MLKDCSFLLSSYDGGEDLWEGFFTALKEQWPEMDMPVYLNTETKQYVFPGYEIHSFAPCKERDMPWAKRLQETLKRIDTEFVLLFLEDFWLDDRVDDAYFRKCLQWMRENEDIATFSFYPCLPSENIDDGLFERMELRPQKCEYKLNCQVAIWRTKKLAKFLRSHEDPWEWEVWGSIRAGRYKERFYTLKEGEKLVFSYGNPEVGCLIHRGRWVKKVALALKEKYNLDIDFSIRGFEDFDVFRADLIRSQEQTFWQKLTQPNVHRKICNKIVRTIRKMRSII